jgi:hypothetical protein
VKTLNTPTVIISVRARPMRSASAPAAAPPMAEKIRVTVDSSPPWPLERPKVLVIAASASGSAW